MEIARWNGHIFEVSSEVVRGFTGLSITGSTETEDTESGGQKYVSRKNGKPKQITLTAILNAQFGCDVKAEAMAFVEEATASEKDYFYIGGKKLMECSLMLVQADVSEVAIAPGGTWVRANVKLTLKQCSKNDGSANGSGSGSGGSGTMNKTSVKQESPKISGLGDLLKSTSKVLESVIKNTENLINGKYNNLWDATLKVEGDSTKSEVNKKIQEAEAAKEKVFASRWVTDNARKESQAAEAKKTTTNSGTTNSPTNPTLHKKIIPAGTLVNKVMR